MIGKTNVGNGKFKFKYSGTCKLNGETCTPNTFYKPSDVWDIQFLTSGTLTTKGMPKSKVDIYLLGGGGGGGASRSIMGVEGEGWRYYDSIGASAGGGGGYRTTLTDKRLKQAVYTVTIGAGGNAGANGGASSIDKIDDCSASGGYAGGNGTAWVYSTGGSGTGNGGGGGYHKYSTNVAIAGIAGGNGAYDFDDSSLTMRAGGGGGGGGYWGWYNTAAVGGAGGSGGGGQGDKYNLAGSSGTTNYGGGGGGYTNNGPFNGGSGIIIMRTHR